MRHLPLLIFVALLFSTGLMASDVEVKAVSGIVKYRPAGQLTTTNVSVGDRLQQGGRILMKQDGQLTLSNLRGDQFEFSGTSYIKLDQLFGDQKQENELSLYRGKGAFKVNTLEKEEAFKIKSPTAVAGVRGTHFSVSVAQNTSTLVQVLESHTGTASLVELTNNVGQSAMVRSGEAARVDAKGTLNTSSISEVLSRPATATGTESTQDSIDNNLEQSVVENIQNNLDQFLTETLNSIETFKLVNPFLINGVEITVRDRDTPIYP